MIAFVLSGGGNRGALEAGALVALFERGIQPDILIGTSAGAVNAAALALNPTLEGAQAVAAMWKTIKQSDIFPGNWFTFAWRFLTGADSLSPNDNIRKLIDTPDGDDRARLDAEVGRIRSVFEQFPLMPALKAAAASLFHRDFWRIVRPPLRELAIDRRRELSSLLGMKD